MHLDCGSAVYHSLVSQAEKRRVELYGRRIAGLSEELATRAVALQDSAERRFLPFIALRTVKPRKHTFALALMRGLYEAKRLQWLCEPFAHGKNRA